MNILNFESNWNNRKLWPYELFSTLLCHRNTHPFVCMEQKKTMTMWIVFYASWTIKHPPNQQHAISFPLCFYHHQASKLLIKKGNQCKLATCTFSSLSLCSSRNSSSSLPWQALPHSTQQPTPPIGEHQCGNGTWELPPPWDSSGAGGSGAEEELRLQRPDARGSGGPSSSAWCTQCCAPPRLLACYALRAAGCLALSQPRKHS